MNKYYTYIATDSNRRFLQTGISQDLNSVYHDLQNSHEPALFSYAMLNRIVLVETYLTQSDAEKRLKELSSMGRIVKERLIRKANPNWLSLCPNTPKIRSNKKAVVYA
ncbi:hypothetical protein [Sphingobacterium sp. 1.A.5]|jgi:predicted GIY-YIG superfamily endonuclease|uniref:hypothetical protein n=1 Tax=Sphingobacterium sp. 1.A.5 TaxID=2044604 RepID=UPI000C0BE57D|nr:hypothetical protein [Sphingobacterium sp. 1.A.5]